MPRLADGLFHIALPYLLNESRIVTDNGYVTNICNCEECYIMTSFISLCLICQSNLRFGNLGHHYQGEHYQSQGACP